MKKYSLLILSLIISVAGYASEKVPGQIIIGNSIEEVTFLIPAGFFDHGGPGVEAMQRGIRYIDSTGKKRRLKTGKATEFRFKFDGNEYRMVSQQHGGSLFSKNIFMLLVLDGKVRMFEYIVTSQSSARANGPNVPITTTYYLLQRGNSPLYEPRLIGFRKGMADFFSDCPKLVSLIEGKDFKRRDLDEIVMYYNTSCN